MRSSSDKYIPGRAVHGRKERFAELNRFVTARGGWVTSIPGAADVAIECLPSSTLPSELAGEGYVVTATGEGERILPSAITEAVITEGSTVPICVTHAGITRVLRYSFRLD